VTARPRSPPHPQTKRVCYTPWGIVKHTDVRHLSSRHHHHRTDRLGERKRPGSGSDEEEGPHAAVQPAPALVRPLDGRATGHPAQVDRPAPRAAGAEEEPGQLDRGGGARLHEPAATRACRAAPVGGKRHGIASSQSVRVVALRRQLRRPCLLRTHPATTTPTASRLGPLHLPTAEAARIIIPTSYENRASAISRHRACHAPCFHRRTKLGLAPSLPDRKPALDRTSVGSWAIRGADSTVAIRIASRPSSNVVESSLICVRQSVSHRLDQVNPLRSLVAQCWRSHSHGSPGPLLHHGLPGGPLRRCCLAHASQRRQCEKLHIHCRKKQLQQSVRPEFEIPAGSRAKLSSTWLPCSRLPRQFRPVLPSKLTEHQSRDSCLARTRRGRDTRPLSRTNRGEQC
jgi:hypothetical protein